MGNIFEGAKFGDKFVTRDGRIAIVIGIYGEEFSHPVNLYIEGENDIREYKLDGTKPTNPKTGFYFLEENPADIVSRYQEPINEEKLDELAQNAMISKIKLNSPAEIFATYKIGYEDGYRKAMEE